MRSRYPFLGSLITPASSLLSTPEWVTSILENYQKRPNLIITLSLNLLPLASHSKSPQPPSFSWLLASHSPHLVLATYALYVACLLRHLLHLSRPGKMRVSRPTPPISLSLLLVYPCLADLHFLWRDSAEPEEAASIDLCSVECSRGSLLPVPGLVTFAIQQDPFHLLFLQE